MDPQVLILLFIIASIGGAGALMVLFGFRVPDLMFLGAALLPMVWLSRFDEHKVTIGESTFVLLWAAFGALFLLGLIFGIGQTRRALKRPMRKVFISLAVLLGFMALSNLLNSTEGNDIIRGINALLFVVLPFAAAWAAVHWCRVDEAGIQRVVLALLLAGSLLALMGFVTAVFPELSRRFGIGVTYRTYGYARAYSPLGGANGTGMVLVIVYCLAFGQLLAGRHRLIGAMALALSFLAILTTLARGALIGFVVANAFLLLGRRRHLTRRLLIGVGLAVILLIPLAYRLHQHYTLERLNLRGTSTFTGRSATARLDTMKASFFYGMDHVLLGGGWGLVYEKPRIRYAYRPGTAERMFTLGDRISLTTPHSLPALVFVESGGPALIALAFFAWSLWRALRVPRLGFDRRGTGLIDGFRAGVLSFMVISLVQDNLFLADKVAYCFYLFAFTGIAASTCYETATQHAYAVEPYQPTPIGRPTGATG
jgi:hypothetical protein